MTTSNKYLLAVTAIATVLAGSDAWGAVVQEEDNPIIVKIYASGERVFNEEVIENMHKNMQSPFMRINAEGEKVFDEGLLRDYEIFQLKNNKIDAMIIYKHRYFDELLSALSQNRSLTWLQISESMTESEYDQLANAITKAEFNLEELVLEKIPGKNVVDILKNIKQPDALRRLTVEGRVNEGDGDELGAAFSRFTKLEEVHLKLNSEVLAKVAGAIAALPQDVAIFVDPILGEYHKDIEKVLKDAGLRKDSHYDEWYNK